MDYLRASAAGRRQDFEKYLAAVPTFLPNPATNFEFNTAPAPRVAPCHRPSPILLRHPARNFRRASCSSTTAPAEVLPRALAPLHEGIHNPGSRCGRSRPPGGGPKQQFQLSDSAQPLGLGLVCAAPLRLLVSLEILLRVNVGVSAGERTLSRVARSPVHPVTKAIRRANVAESSFARLQLTTASLDIPASPQIPPASDR